MSTNNNTTHQYATGELFVAFREWMNANGSGRVVLGPVNVRLQEQARLIQPDLFIAMGDNWSGDSKVYEGAPDLVAEVLNDDSYRIDKVVKYISYEQMGVKEYWIVNPKMQSIEVYSLSNKEYMLVGDFQADEMIVSPLLEGIELQVGAIFPENVQYNDEVPASTLGESMVPA
ncbi:MAG: Uma2 family endonuclease [Anaerolineae bacterium]